MKIGFLTLSLLAAMSLYAYPKDKQQNNQDNKARKTEIKADQKFVRQEFEQAMKLYESALTKNASNTYNALLHLKTARLYLNLLNYTASIPHYEKAMLLNEDLFNASDICNYLDALRYSGAKMEAVRIARKYAYRDVYNKDQRYLNIVHALDFEAGFMPVGVPEFIVERLDKGNTPFSEFWVGKMDSEYIYATSNSKFHDPNKKFYHRTKYYSLDENSEFSLNAAAGRKKRSRELLHMVPIDLQNGPLSFAEDMSRMIVTSLSYDKGEQIDISSKGINAFKTKLYYSNYNSKRNGWSSFELALPQKKEASYAHPFLFDNDRFLLFSSDMPGGYGGYDIYISEWDNELQRWGDPVNLGAQVNTEGDEISPTIYDDLLIFASNGHVGFGGYDIYGILYEKGVVTKGSLMHFDYPINSVLNDFSMLRIDNDRGYIVSDRLLQHQDDIFYFYRNNLKNKNSLIYGMSETNAISSGAISLIKDGGDFNAPRHEQLPKYSFYTESMLTVYFDFDNSELNYTAIEALQNFLDDTDFSQVESLIIDGYTDEMGGDGYNLLLSEKRAESVYSWLMNKGINVKTKIAGKGQIFLTKKDMEDDRQEPIAPFYNRELQYNKVNSSTWEQKIWINRKARRVEIKAIIKQ